MNNNINEALGINNSPESKDTDKRQQNNTNPLIFSKWGAAIAVICILFLPVVGCGGENMNGVDILKERQIGGGVKFFLVVSIVCGIIILFLKQFMQSAITAIIGIVALLISYFIAKEKIGQIELKIGAFLGIMGYMTTVIIGFMNHKPGLAVNPGPAPSTSKPGNTEVNDTVTQIERLNDLRVKGILTEEEFLEKKKELLNKM